MFNLLSDALRLLKFPERIENFLLLQIDSSLETGNGKVMWVPTDTTLIRIFVCRGRIRLALNQILMFGKRTDVFEIRV